MSLCFASKARCDVRAARADGKRVLWLRVLGVRKAQSVLGLREMGSGRGKGASCTGLGGQSWHSRVRECFDVSPHFFASVLPNAFFRHRSYVRPDQQTLQHKRAGTTTHPYLCWAYGTIARPPSALWLSQRVLGTRGSQEATPGSSVCVSLHKKQRKGRNSLGGPESPN